MELVFSQHAFRELSRLDKKARQRMIAKLEFYAAEQDPLRFAEHLVDAQLGEWRFRIGDYRVIGDYETGKFFVLKIGHRREIYR